MNTNPDDHPVHLTARELAARLHISVRTVYNRRSRGEDLPPSINYMGRPRWRLSDVIAWEESHLKKNPNHNPLGHWSISELDESKLNDDSNPNYFHYPRPEGKDGEEFNLDAWLDSLITAGNAALANREVIDMEADVQFEFTNPVTRDNICAYFRDRCIEISIGQEPTEADAETPDPYNTILLNADLVERLCYALLHMLEAKDKDGTPRVD